MTDANKRLTDAGIRHAIWLQRYGRSHARTILKDLRTADAELGRKIEDRLAKLGPVDRQTVGRGQTTTRRLIAMRQEIQTQTREIEAAVAGTNKAAARALARQSAELAATRLGEAIGAHTAILRPSPETLRAIVDGRVIRGQTLRQWWRTWGANRLGKVDGAVRMGVIQAETIPQIMRRVRDQLAISRRSAETLARTSVTAVAAQSRDALYQDNADIISGVRWVSTLDGRTSAICQALDGKVFPVDSGQRPPAHPNCRSTTVPVTRSWDELAAPGALAPGRGSTNFETLFREQLAKQGFSPDQIPGIMAHARSSMSGPVARDLTYPDWLRTQPAAFQVDVLGKTRAALFRDGRLDLQAFVDLGTGRKFTLRELAAREQQAWAKATLPAPVPERPPLPPEPVPEPVPEPPAPPLPLDAPEILESPERLRAALKSRGVEIEELGPQHGVFYKLDDPTSVRRALTPEETQSQISAFARGLARLEELAGGRTITRRVTFLPGFTTRGRAHLGLSRQADGRALVKVNAFEYPEATHANLRAWENSHHRRWGTASHDPDGIRASIARHELGHIITDRQAHIEFSQVWTDNGPEWFRDNVSEYAGTNIWEAIAESFTTFTARGYARGTLPARIEEILDGMLERAAAAAEA